METLQPKLRFPGFDGDWDKKTLGEIFSIFNGYAFSSADSVDDGVLWVKIADVGIQEMKKDNLSFLPNEYVEKHEKFVLKKDDYVVALTRPILNGKLKIAKIDDFFNGSLLNQRVGKLVTEFNATFVFNILQKDLLIKSIENNISGTDPPNLSPNEISFIESYIPSVPEQTRIANFLSAVDEKLNLLKEKKALLEDYKKGIMQKIFNQEIRFKDDNGNDFEEWDEFVLSDLFSENKTRNKKNEVEEVFSVAKAKGVVNQIEHLGRSYASSNVSNYKVVYPNDIIYTKSPTSDFPYGIIKQNKLNRTGIVSVLYGVFTPINKYVGLLIDYYFSDWKNTYNYLDPIVQKGAKNTINIGNETFLNGASIFFPVDEKEQIKIANFLSTFDEKIELVTMQIERTQEYKKGLLQQMFV